MPHGVVLCMPGDATSVLCIACVRPNVMPSDAGIRQWEIHSAKVAVSLWVAGTKLHAINHNGDDDCGGDGGGDGGCDDAFDSFGDALIIRIS